jgi:hypothetical protein
MMHLPLYRNLTLVNPYQQMIAQSEEQVPGVVFTSNAITTATSLETRQHKPENVLCCPVAAWNVSSATPATILWPLSIQFRD